jgi:hypothetical protein
VSGIPVSWPSPKPRARASREGALSFLAHPSISRLSVEGHLWAAKPSLIHQWVHARAPDGCSS